MFFRTALFAVTTVASASALAANSVSNASFVNGIAIPGGLLDATAGSDFDRRVGFFSDIYYDRARNEDRKSTRLNSSHSQQSRMPSSA